jgi:hypothetical protein
MDLKDRIKKALELLSTEDVPAAEKVKKVSAEDFGKEILSEIQKAGEEAKDNKGRATRRLARAKSFMERALKALEGHSGDAPLSLELFDGDLAPETAPTAKADGETPALLKQALAALEGVMKALTPPAPATPAVVPAAPAAPATPTAKSDTPAVKWPRDLATGVIEEDPRFRRQKKEEPKDDDTDFGPDGKKPAKKPEEMTDEEKKAAKDDEDKKAKEAADKKAKEEADKKAAEAADKK